MVVYLNPYSHRNPVSTEFLVLASAHTGFESKHVSANIL